MSNPLAQQLRETWDSVQWPTARALEWARALIADSNVEAVVAVGSAARGRARPSSDVDLIVVCINARENVRAPGEVDARWIEVGSLQKAVVAGDDIVAWGIAFGTVLYDPKEIWQKLVEQWTGCLPLPSWTVCAERAGRARRYLVDLIEVGDREAASEQALTMLTHEARLALCKAGIRPASRPELVDQLEALGASELATLLDGALKGTLEPREALACTSKLVSQRESCVAKHRFATSSRG